MCGVEPYIHIILHRTTHTHRHTQMSSYKNCWNSNRFSVTYINGNFLIWRCTVVMYEGTIGFHCVTFTWRSSAVYLELLRSLYFKIESISKSATIIRLVLIVGWRKFSFGVSIIREQNSPTSLMDHDFPLALFSPILSHPWVSQKACEKQKGKRLDCCGC